MKLILRLKKTKLPNYSNLSAEERKVLQELQSRDDTVITEADEGDAVVILETVNKMIKGFTRKFNK